MSDFALQVEKLGKVFRIYDKPSDRLKETFSFGRKNYHTDFPALRNISFHVKKGEFLGIVGRNGAGKSTLLKILSGELTPSEGTVTIDGNVSLLQLGVGFDLELSGIENARFASKLLGYSNREIDRMLKDIIEFADIGDFIYHPVKTYSSGMYSRLSFAVGVNINPDILIADEVLAVGDLRFAQKCLRKMREFKDKGKTIVLVTHDTSTVNIFCDTAIWLKDGELFQSGDAQSVAKDYTNYMLYDKLPYQRNTGLPLVASDKSDYAIDIDADSTTADNLSAFDDVEWEDLSTNRGIGDGRVEILRMAFILAGSKKRVTVVNGNETVILLLDIVTKDRIENPHFGYVLYNSHGIVALHSNNVICGHKIDHLPKDKRIIGQFRFDLPNLSNGSYIFAVGLQSNDEMPQRIHDVHEFRVVRDDIKGSQCGYVIVEKENFDMHYMKNS